MVSQPFHIPWQYQEVSSTWVRTYHDERQTVMFFVRKLRKPFFSTSMNMTTDPKYVKKIKATTTFEPRSKVTTSRAGDYKRDAYGEGTLPYTMCPPKRPPIQSKARSRDCSFPLTVYQTSIGELARRYLCGEERMEKNVTAEPPCNFCEFIEPPCKGYYRRHDCIRPAEEECIEYANGERIFRNRIDRYWEPCLSEAARHLLYVKQFGQKNVNG